MDNVFASFIKDKGLYDTMVITKENIEDLIDLVYGRVKLNCYCKDCSEMRIFSMKPISCISQTGSEKFEVTDLGGYLSRVQNVYKMASIPYPGEAGTDVEWFWAKSECFEDTRIIVFRYMCSLNENHRIDYIVRTEANMLWKIGQYPSVADLAFLELNTYNKVIDEESRKELRRAIGLYAQGIGIGSYVYLRRVFERILDKAKEQACQNGELDISAFNAARVAERIPMLKDYLPEMMVRNASIYGIISKGIHELSESDCISFFPIMKDSIYMILSKWEEKRKAIETEAELSAAISKINSDLK